MSRKRFSERQVIESLIRTGAVIQCYRTKERITLENVGRLEREHPVPLALGGADDPTNAAYSLSEAHSIQTNGTASTSAGSDKHMIAKSRGTRAEKFEVAKLPLDVSRADQPTGRCHKCGEDSAFCECHIRPARQSAFRQPRRA